MRRLVFPVLLLFWTIMNVLLWRAEYGDASHGSRVSRDVVIDKIFNAPDASNLQVFQSGKSLGFVQWEIIPDEIYFRGTNQPVGRVESIDGYTLAVDGRVDVAPLQDKVRLSLRAGLDSELDWQDLHATMDTGNNRWEFHSIKTNEVLNVKYTGALGQWEREASFTEMNDPAKMVEQFAGPTLGPLIKPMLPPLGQANAGEEIGSLSFGLEWDAFNDAMRLGSTRVRIYRLEFKLPGERKIIVRVSRVGEILQVQFPGQLVMDNESIPLRKPKEP